MLKKITNLNNWIILILLPAGILIFLVVLVVRPLLLIRFGEIMTYRIGHSLRPFEIYFANKQLEKNTKSFQKKIDIFFFSSMHCNQFLTTICKRSVLTIPFQFIFIPSKILKWLGTFNEFFKKNIINMRIYDFDKNNALDKTKQVLSFTKSEIEKGDRLLERFGINKNDKFVCFATRDNNYLNKYLTYPNQANPEYNLRNSDVETYKLAAEELVKLGYKVIRSGKYPEKKISFSNSNIIDYANSDYASDFLDIYLSYKCEFAFGDTSGWSTIAMAFRKYFAFVNWHTFATLDYSSKKNIFIFKKFYSKDKGKILSLDEIKEANLVDARSYDLEEKNIQAIDNTPQEIKDLVIEVEKRYKGELRLSEKDLQLQEKFRNYVTNEFSDLIKICYPNQGPGINTKNLISCGTNFLKTLKFS